MNGLLAVAALDRRGTHPRSCMLPCRPDSQRAILRVCPWAVNETEKNVHQHQWNLNKSLGGYRARCERQSA